MPTEPDSFPSDFYVLVEGAADAVLEFPADDGSGGPFWNDDGQLDLVRCKEWDQEEVGVVPLGGNRYRLAERQLGPFSGLRLYWGDEFNADKGEDGTLRLTSVCVPRPYAHFRFLTSGGFNNEHQLARHLHSLGGGWVGGSRRRNAHVDRSSRTRQRIKAFDVRRGPCAWGAPP